MSASLYLLHKWSDIGLHKKEILAGKKWKNEKSTFSCLSRPNLNVLSTYVEEDTSDLKNLKHVLF